MQLLETEHRTGPEGIKMRTNVTSTLVDGRWQVVPESSTATFTIRHWGMALTGTMPIADGFADVADGNVVFAAGAADIGRIASGNARRDKDLRKPRLLDLDNHPTMSFAAVQTRQTPTGWRVTGTASARGTDFPLEFDVEAPIAADDGTVELRASALLDRTLLFPAPRFVIGRLITVTVLVRITR